jgi:single-strand DNA-binding protein
LHNIVIKGGLVNVVENYVNKGQEIAVEGKLTNRSYDTKEGEKRYVTEILVNELLLMGSKQ